MATDKTQNKKPVKTFILDASAINTDGAEVFRGLNVLKLNAGQGVDGLVISGIGTQKVKGRGKEKGKTREIPSYSAKAPDGLEYRLPLNKSFVDKATEAKLKIGDVIALVCEGGYTSKDGNKGIGFTVIVRKRK